MDPAEEVLCWFVILFGILAEFSVGKAVIRSNRDSDLFLII